MIRTREKGDHCTYTPAILKFGTRWACSKSPIQLHATCNLTSPLSSRRSNRKLSRSSKWDYNLKATLDSLMVAMATRPTVMGTQHPTVCANVVYIYLIDSTTSCSSVGLQFMDHGVAQLLCRMQQSTRPQVSFTMDCSSLTCYPDTLHSRTWKQD